MKTILILEGNSKSLAEDARSRVGVTPAENYGRALKSQDSNISYRIIAPYETSLNEGDFENVDGVVLTGSGVPWSVDAPEAAPLRSAVTSVFDKGLPVLGSCNGMQLAAVILGGIIGASPNGMEIGLALDINRTQEGKQHPLLKGREDCYAVPCVHRDEVQKLPEKAILLAENAHSPIQAFSYECEGIDFWGMQYHPEFTAAWVANLLRTPETIWQNSDKADALDIADTDQTAAKELGVLGNDLRPNVRMTELRNWLGHIS
ncbi:MAG: type 1 glutamine amidotransferase [Granulosicoccaceae bacterium]